MRNTDHARERLESARENGLSLQQIETLIDRQNEAHDAFHRGDIDYARALAYEAQELSYEFGDNDTEWFFYH